MCENAYKIMMPKIAGPRILIALIVAEFSAAIGVDISSVILFVGQPIMVNEIN